MRTAGLFFSHVRGARIDAHYARLVRESGERIEWRFVRNRGNHPAPRSDLPCQAPRNCLPLRYREAMLNGGVVGGYLDTAIWPCLLSIDAEFTWVMEYDVDFSGSWGSFFERFQDDDADLLTAWICSRPEADEWFWWRSARAPAVISEARMLRGFHPLIRVSRRFAEAYRRIVADPGWGGHYEFTLPTVAVAAGLRLGDIGGGGPSPACRHLTRETFRWKPAQPFYFHEAPEQFPLPEKLYHPVKPQTLAAPRQPSRLLKTCRKIVGRCLSERPALHAASAFGVPE
ncbi:MAG: hypothetical protein M3177_04020 [Pseudomonadota bacterium]|nr:hypothetical protein [Pseudomonadota bacterium]